MLRLLKTILMDKTGYEVIGTNNPLEVQSLIKDNNYDLIITAMIRWPWLNYLCILVGTPG